MAVEAWFSDLKEALGVSPKTDRGRVLASVRKLVADNDSYDEEKRVVATALKYKRWGDLYTWASQQLVATPEVELPEVFSEPPNGWVFRPGGDYDKAQKRLVKTRLRLKELWAALDAEVAADPSNQEWAESIKAQAIKEFETSREASEFDQLCLAFVRGYEEEDPATTWVEVADEAAALLERDYDLPAVVASELLSYAEVTGVEATKKVVTMTRGLQNPAAAWFDYLLTAYLYNRKRVEDDEVWKVRDLFYEATGLLGCFEEVSANIPERPSLKKRRYEPSVTLAQVAAAVRKLAEMKEENRLDRTWDDWRDAVKEAVTAVTDEEEVTAMA